MENYGYGEGDETPEVTPMQAAPTNGQAKPRLGDAVYYITSRGTAAAALVTGTPESVREGTSVPVPQGRELTLLVLSPSGNGFTRQAVPYVDDAETVEGSPVRVWTYRT